jgi:plasmid stability protein
VRTSRRYHLLLPPELEADLKIFARQHGRSLADAFRSLAAIGVAAERGETLATPPDSPAALAALTASEHAVLMVASVLPEGERRMRSLAVQATLAARERLALFHLPSGGTEDRQ